MVRQELHRGLHGVGDRRARLAGLAGRDVDVEGRLTMKWAGMLAVLGLVGCGNTIPEVDPESPRLQVTSVLLQVCEGDSDAQIRSSLVAAEADRLLGLTWTEQTISVGFACLNDGACAECFQAIIDQVYGVVDEEPPSQAVPQCVRDSDCDDRVFCNGTETCVGQVCFAGILPCPGLICDEGSDACRAAPEEEEPPSDTIRIHPGLYSGSVTCVEEGFTFVDIVTVEFNDDGDLIGNRGIPFRVGDSFSGSIGTTVDAQIITSLERGESSFVIRGEQVSTACDNTCRFSFDAECDETFDNLGPCALGTDCFDCGPFALEALATITVIAIDDSNLRFLRETTWASPQTSTLTFTSVCDGTITR